MHRYIIYFMLLLFACMVPPSMAQKAGEEIYTISRETLSPLSSSKAPETCNCEAIYRGPFSKKPSAAFLGRVIKRRPHYHGRVFVQLEVYSAWGEDYTKASKVFTVYNPKDPCHYNMQLGEIYLVDPLYLEKRMFATEQCSFTRPSAAAEKDLENLGKPLYSFEHNNE